MSKKSKVILIIVFIIFGIIVFDLIKSYNNQPYRTLQREVYKKYGKNNIELLEEKRNVGGEGVNSIKWLFLCNGDYIRASVSGHMFESKWEYSDQKVELGESNETISNILSEENSVNTVREFTSEYDNGQNGYVYIIMQGEDYNDILKIKNKIHQIYNYCASKYDDTLIEIYISKDSDFSSKYYKIYPHRINISTKDYTYKGETCNKIIENTNMLDRKFYMYYHKDKDTDFEKEFDEKYNIFVRGY